MDRIGIFLGFGPGQPIKNQGIGRLLAFIIKGIVASDNKKIVIAIPHWYKDQISDLIADQRININKIEIITTPETPLWARMAACIAKNTVSVPAGVSRPLAVKISSRLYKLARVPYRLIRKLRRMGHDQFYNFIITPSKENFTSKRNTYLFFSLLLSPIILFTAGCEAVFQRISLLLKKIKNQLPYQAIDPLKNPLYILKKFRFFYFAYHVLRTREMEKLIRMMNERSDISTWFIPGLFWPEISGIKAKKIVAAPDVVFIDFPNHFTSHRYYYQYTYECMVKSIKVGDHFVCYSDYVKQNHLVVPFKVNPDKITVIKHGITDMSHYQGSHSRDKPVLESNNSALIILNNHQESRLQNNAYLRDIDFGSLRYIFYSSQQRPYKNFLNFIKAYEILLRERFINFKLITTAELNRDKEVNQYIHDRRLQHDIVSFPHVSSKVLGALNQLALCAVNPTLFEGGFPFTFSEAYSVGTPSVMSKIPVVLSEVHDPLLQEKMLFDPHNVQDMANKIEWGIKNRDALLALQRPLYDQFKQRTWETVTDDYVELLSRPL